jgi:hypothetical protein
MSLFCQSGYTLVGGKCVKLVTTTTAWSTAETACESDGGHLASITSSADNAAITSAYSASAPIWIGLTDAAVEGTFVWVDGTPFSYSNWLSPNPDNTGPAGGPANCAMLQDTGQWNDRVCADNYNYLCETRPITCKTGYTLTGTKCTKLGGATSSWSAAEATCESDGGTLVTSSSATDNAAITSAYSASAPIWIGLTDTAVEGTFVWVDGTPFSYSNWLSPNPDNTGPAGGPANCVMLQDTGQWNDRVCADNYNYVCQTPDVTRSPTGAPTITPTLAPSSAPTFTPSSEPTFTPTLAPSSEPTLNPTLAPSSQPTSAPTEYIPSCAQLLSLDDAHGSYATWATSFLKFEGNFAYDDIMHGDFGYTAGYVSFMDALAEAGIVGTLPALLLGLRYGPGATFSVVPGKLNSNGELIPCEVEVGGGACFDSHSWEMGLSAKSFFNSFYTTETSAWIAPYGSSMTNECFPESEMAMFTDSRLRPVSFTGEGRAHNNVRPPSFHAPAPLPHESVELSLTLKDGSGFGWWNTLKFHPNQYVLDDGKKIVHRGTLVDKAEVTEKVRLNSLPPCTPLTATAHFFSSPLYVCLFSSASVTAPTLSACWAISMWMLMTTLGLSR